MVKINKIYTRTGDDGTTGLVGGARVRKDSLRVDTYGEIDELNALIGWARTLAGSPRKRSQLVKLLARIQNELFDLGAQFASPAHSSHAKVPTITAAHHRQLEADIDALTLKLPELRSFVLPGGTVLNSALHIARTVCRRVERRALTLAAEEPVAKDALVYLNRLSDLLFAMARFESAVSSSPEYLWIPAGTPQKREGPSHRGAKPPQKMLRGKGTRKFRRGDISK